MFKDVFDIKALFDGSEELNDTLTLTKPVYDFTDLEIGIFSPFVITSNVQSKLICQKLVIRAKNVTLSGIDLNCSVIIHTAESITIKNCNIIDGLFGCGGGIVITQGNEIIIDNVFIQDLKMTAVFIETNSSVVIKNSRFLNISENVINVSAVSQALIENCEIGQAQCSAIVVSLESFAEINNCEIHHVLKNSSIHVYYSEISCSHTSFHDIEQSGISIIRCNEGKFLNNTFKDIKSSCISVSSESSAFISENSFENIGGNSVFISDISKAHITNNVINNSEYPAFAILQKCSADVSFNKISDIKKAGICIRGASRAFLDSNSFENILDCGVSISDSVGCVLMKNTFKNCAVGGIEAYNQTRASIQQNIFEDCGKYGILVYTGANVTASKNKLINVSDAFVHLSTVGGGEFQENEIIKCDKQYDGDTTGTFLFKDNGTFESVTNNQENTDESVTVVPVFKDPYFGKCFKCRAKDRLGFCSPCGHAVFCEECGKEASKNGEKCPLCRFEIQSYTDVFNIAEDSKCTLCYEKNADCVVLPCGHTGFCSDCLNEWFMDKISCPICRAEPSSFKKIMDGF